jgi:hypothetical protein
MQTDWKQSSETNLQMDAQTHNLQLPAKAQALGGSLWNQNCGCQRNLCQMKTYDQNMVSFLILI